MWPELVRGRMGRVKPGHTSLSRFPTRGTYHPICEYLCTHLCALVDLCLHFFEEDGMSMSGLFFK